MFWLLKKTHLIETPQHMFWLRNKIFFIWYALLTKDMKTSRFSMLKLDINIFKGGGTEIYVNYFF